MRRAGDDSWVGMFGVRWSLRVDFLIVTGTARDYLAVPVLSSAETAAADGTEAAHEFVRG